jgi:hypothetical protein
MYIVKTIPLHFNINISELSDNNFKNYINSLCKVKLIENIHEDTYIENILHTVINPDKKINIDGSIRVNVVCQCKIIDLQIHSKYDITINEINKMGYSFKTNKLCIFLPIHLCGDSTYQISDTISVQIIGKRIEDSIICIAKPSN